MKNIFSTRLPWAAALLSAGLAQSATAQTSVFKRWPLTTDANDDATVRVGSTASAATLRRFVLSNGTQVPTAPAYSTMFGQAFGVQADGGGWSSNNTPPGPGSVPRRYFSEQFTVTAPAGSSVRIDSLLFNASIYNSASGNVAVSWSRSNYVSDSSTITSSKGPAGPLPATNNGSFGVGPAGTIVALSAALPQQGAAPSPALANSATQYRFEMNGANGIVLTAGQTLTVRLHFGVASTSAGRYVLLHDVILKGKSGGVSAVRTSVQKNLLTLAPNPAAEQLTITHPVAEAGTSLKVYNLVGKQVAAVAVAAASAHTELNLQMLPAGLYVVEYNDGTQRITARVSKL